MRPCMEPCFWAVARLERGHESEENPASSSPRGPNFWKHRSGLVCAKTPWKNASLVSCKPKILGNFRPIFGTTLWFWAGCGSASWLLCKAFRFVHHNFTDVFCGDTIKEVKICYMQKIVKVVISAAMVFRYCNTLGDWERKSSINYKHIH